MSNSYAVRYIPQKSTKVATKGFEAVAYLFETSKGAPAAIVYMGKQSKPFGNYSFQNSEKRARYVEKAFQSIKDHYDRVANRRKERCEAGHSLQVGHVLVSKWGYDQTNCDFYQVTALIGSKTVEIRPIGSLQAAKGNESWLTGHVIPNIDNFTGEPMRKRAIRDHVGIEHGRYASIWDGKPEWYSSYA